MFVAVCVLLYPKIFKQTVSVDSGLESIQTNSLLAVLPFSNSKLDPETDYLGFAIADQIIGGLVYLQNITVRPSSSIRKYGKQLTGPIEVGDELQDIVTQKVVEGMDVQFSQKEMNNIGKDIPDNPLAYEYYLRSISYQHTIDGDQLAIEMLKKSIEVDSSSAPWVSHT